jgi:hypothetical protein
MVLTETQDRHGLVNAYPLQGKPQGPRRLRFSFSIYLSKSKNPLCVLSAELNPYMLE